MCSPSAWRAGAAALIVVALAALPALAAARGLSADQNASGEGRGGVRSLVEGLFGTSGEGRAGEPAARLRSLSTAPQTPRLATPGPVASDLERRNPRLRIDAAAPDVLTAVEAVPGVWGAAEFGLVELPVGAGADLLEVGFVDPAGFRVFTPEVTASSESLWRGLADGEAVLSFDVAHRLGVRAGDDLRVDGRRFRVAGVATLAPADVAQVLLRTSATEDLGVEPAAGTLVGVDRLSDLDLVRARLVDAGVGEVSVVEVDAPYRAELVGDAAVVAAFEPFTFTHRGGGLFDIDPEWIDRNITRATVPVLGQVRCHRLIIPQLRAALEEIVALGLDHLLDPDDYGGCWVPRHIGFDESRPLSLHAWGIAFDVNVHTNLYGDPPQLDRRIVEVFDRHGFDWGGHWRTPDGMHFELRELTEPPD